MEYILLVVGILLFIGVVWTLNLLFFRPFSINLFFQRVMFKFAMANPEILSMIRMFERFGFYGHNKKLNDESDEFQQKQNAQIKSELDSLQKYDRSKLAPAKQLSYDIMEWFLKDTIAGQNYRHHNYPVNQLFGVQNQFPTFMVSTHQVKTKRDAEHYIIRLSKIRTKFEQVLGGLKIREQKGIIPPLFVFEKVLDEMQNFTAVPAEENILYINMDEKLAKVSGLGEADKAALLARTKKEIQGTVYPAYQLLISYFHELKEKASADAGVWKLPDGDKYYQYLLKRYTTTDLSAEEIHTIGLAEVGRIQNQMRGILDGLGYSSKHPIEHMNDLAQDPRFAYADDDESREQVLKDYQAMIDKIDQNLDHLFDIRPKAKVIVERIPPFKEKTAPGAYYTTPAMDGSRPGIFYANLLQLPRKFNMETLAYHEAIPGHHFQLAIQQELKGLPIFRKLIPFTAYAEGWALYTEKLAFENNLFSDQYSVLGFLASELFRAVRLVVDTGLHHKKWTREQAIEYMVENTGTDKVDIIIEVERYIVMPGQATAYKIGELEMVKLRAMAMEKLGDAFDIREFHNIILKNGSVPLKILEGIVHEYIASKGVASETETEVA